MSKLNKKSAEVRAPYDALAAFYNREWGPRHVELLNLFDRIGLAELPPPRCILDLCCGTGQVAGALAARGHLVTAVDLSYEMLRFAAVNAPTAHLVCADVSRFESEAIYSAAVCTWNGFTELLDPDDFSRTCVNVRRALREGGVFLFDMTLDGAMQHQWGQPFTVLHADRACLAFPRYCTRTRLGETDFTVFVEIEGGWRRSDVTLTQRGYHETEIRRALIDAGFERVDVYDAERDLRLPGQGGRAFFRAQ